MNSSIRGIVPSASLVLLMLAAGSAWAGGEIAVPPAATKGAPHLQAPAGVPLDVQLAGDYYQEYLSYGAYVRRSHMPGFIPQTESLWENPRTWPSAVCKIAYPYYYANTPGWFFGSPNGYQSSVPPNSIAHKYVTGQLGITTSLQYGYPRGMRVVEPIIVPFASYAEPGGLLITSDGHGVRMPQPQPPPQQITETVTEQLEKTGSPSAPAPAPSAPLAPLVPEVSDK